MEAQNVGNERLLDDMLVFEYFIIMRCIKLNRVVLHESQDYGKWTLACRYAFFFKVLHNHETYQIKPRGAAWKPKIWEMNACLQIC